MKISFENADKVNGLMTITVEEADYKDEVEKTLKDYRKRANVPGFRQGQVPMGLIMRQYGPQVKMEAINKILGENLQKYITDNKIQMLGQPMGSESQEAVDLEKPAPYVFKFDIAVAPEFKIELNGKNKIDFYEIAVDDKLIDQQVEMFQSRAGHYDKAESFDPEQRDLLKGDLRELDEGASLMPQYIKVEDQKKLFDGAKLGDIITFNPTAAYPDNEIEVSSLLKIKKEEVAEHKGNFSYQITEISRFVKAENNEDLWKNVYGEDADIKTEADFRNKIAEGLKEQLKGDSDYKFIQDLRAYCEKKVGELTFPDAILKRIMLANNQDKGEEFVEKNYAQSIKELTWHLIKEQLANDHDIKVNDDDVRESARQMARAQFAQYGMTNVPEDYLNGYADELLKKRENIDNFVEAALDRKLAAVIKDVVKLNVKTVSLEEFNKLVSE